VVAAFPRQAKASALYIRIEVRQMALFLLLIIVAILLGIIGAVVEGLFYLLIIGVIVLVADLVFLRIRLGRRGAGKRRVR
jgi:hypothetical protein